MRKSVIILAVLIVLLGVLHAQAAELHLHLLDVGEGQAVLLHKNKRAVLIDTGHAGAARQVLKRIHDQQIESLDYLILTHLHPDHASGLFRIHEAYPQAVVADSCYPVAESLTPDMIRWTDQALQQISKRQCLKAGDRINWAGTEISVLWPRKQPAEKSALNRSSLVLQVSHNEKTLLIMGDAGHDAEQALLKTDRLGDVDILVVGHHGADDATSEAFLRTIRPETALISINKNNARGYPSPKVLKLLETLGIAVHKTYQDGEFSFVF